MERNLNKQELFWRETYAEEYANKNSNFDTKLLLEGWSEILRKIKTKPTKILECGANIGRNIDALKNIYPETQFTAIEISSVACAKLIKKFPTLEIINTSILESNLKSNNFDIVFTMGVLIHIHPDDLLSNLEIMKSYSSKYIIFGEYFNRTPTQINYQGEEDTLFKNDFGKIFIDNFRSEYKLLDYGFLWGYIYDLGGFDDITWWVFEKI